LQDQKGVPSKNIIQIPATLSKFIARTIFSGVYLIIMSIDQDITLSIRVQKLISNALQVPDNQIHADLEFGDLPQWDSMGHMEVMLSLEERFGIEIDAEIIASLTSVPTISNYLKENGYA
jgi:acyl carrier protein